MPNKMQIELDEQTNYPGSKVFASLANAAGLSVDLVSSFVGRRKASKIPAIPMKISAT